MLPKLTGRDHQKHVTWCFEIRSRTSFRFCNRTVRAVKLHITPRRVALLVAKFLWVALKLLFLLYTTKVAGRSMLGVLPIFAVAIDAIRYSNLSAICIILLFVRTGVRKFHWISPWILILAHPNYYIYLDKNWAILVSAVSLRQINLRTLCIPSEQPSFFPHYSRTCHATVQLLVFAIPIGFLWYKQKLPLNLRISNQFLNVTVEHFPQTVPVQPYFFRGTVSSLQRCVTRFVVDSSPDLEWRKRSSTFEAFVILQ